MTPQMAILVIPAFGVLIGLVLHSLHFRGRRETLLFFVGCALFGIARGNIIWWITTVHFEGKFPYIFQKQLLGVFHDSLTADAGWIICSYLGAFLAFRIADRIPWARGRVFPLISLACLFNVCLSYAVESTAITMGWWEWTLSTKSRIFRDVPVAGIWAWGSIGVDFLFPYVLIRMVRRPGQWWPYLSLLIFPFHMLTHLSNDRLADWLPIVPYDLYYWVMLLAILILPFTVDLRMHRPLFPPRALGRTRSGEAVPGAREAWARNIPFLGLGVVVGVLLWCDLGIHHEAALLTGKVPLALYTLLAVPAVPAVAVLGAGALLPIFGGSYFLAPLTVPLFYFALRGRDGWTRAPWLRWVYVAIPAALTVWFYVWAVERHEVDMKYWALITEGRTVVRQDEASAEAKFEAAAALKPYSLPAYEELIVLEMKRRNLDRAKEILDRMLQLRPISEEVHANFGTLYVLRGDYDTAETWFRRALELNPRHAYSRDMLRNLDRLRRGEGFDEELTPP